MSFTYDANCCSQPDLCNALLTNSCNICNKNWQQTRNDDV